MGSTFPTEGTFPTDRTDAQKPQLLKNKDSRAQSWLIRLCWFPLVAYGPSELGDQYSIPKNSSESCNRSYV